MQLSGNLSQHLEACGVICELPQCERGCTCASSEPINTSGQPIDRNHHTNNIPIHTCKGNNNEISDSKTSRLSVPILAAGLGRTRKPARITSQLRPSIKTEAARRVRSDTTKGDSAVKSVDQDEKNAPVVESHDEDGENTTQSILYGNDEEKEEPTADGISQDDEESWKRGRLDNLTKRGIRLERHSEKGVNDIVYGGKLVELGFPEWLAKTFGPCVIDIDLPHLPAILVTPEGGPRIDNRYYRPTPNKRMKIMANVNNLLRFRAFETVPLNQEKPFCLVIGSQINEDGWKRELNAMVESDEHFTQTLIRLNLAICMPPTKKEYDDFNSSQSQIYILDASDEDGIATFIEHVNVSTKSLHPSSSYKNLHFAITLLGFGTSKEVNPTSYIASKLRPLL